MNSMDRYRQIGRTTKMVVVAVRIAVEEEKNVVIVVKSRTEIERISKLLKEAVEYLNINVYDHKLKFNFISELQAVCCDFIQSRIYVREFSAQTDRISTMNFPEDRHGGNYKVLVDHWAIEQEYLKMLDMLHRFDI